MVVDVEAAIVRTFKFTYQSSLEWNFTMTAPHIVDPAGLPGEALAESSPDFIRQLLQSMINALLSADPDAVVGGAVGKTQP